jgi:hypothetical protein
LSIPCQECGFANEPAERYCGGCGHTLGGGETIVAMEPARTTDPEGDRRPVTVLFCDLVGYTHLSSVLDPEDVHALLERFFALVDATVDRFGGTIDKHIGDAAMALFGAPLARGNDAERAVRAALEIQTSVPKLASGLASELEIYARSRRGFSFELRPLEGPDEGTVERDIDYEMDGETQSLGLDGHATCYYAIIVKSTRPAPPAPTTLAELRAHSRRSIP